MTEEPGSERWNWLAEGNAKQARKRVAVDVLIRNSSGSILLVNPTYKDGWDMPGGMSESNESPSQTARRELLEELSLTLKPVRLLLVDWIEPHGPWDDLLTFILDGGVLEESVEKSVRIDNGELAGWNFFQLDEALARLPWRVAGRLTRAFECLLNGEVSFSEVRAEAGS